MVLPVGATVKHPENHHLIVAYGEGHSQSPLETNDAKPRPHVIPSGSTFRGVVKIQANRSIRSM